jgi:hypothetical protein
MDFLRIILPPTARREPIEWDAVFAGYRATVDFPAANFWAELAQAHPEAKVVLTVRDPNRWYDSAAGAFGSIPAIDASMAGGYVLSKAMGLLAPRLWSALTAMQEMREGEGVTFDGSPEDRKRATQGFEEHVRGVKERVPPERLQVFEVKEGWGPLCAFLGVEVPEGEPFPHLYEGEQFPQLMRRTVLSELAPRLDKAAAAASALALGVWALGRVMQPTS